MASVINIYQGSDKNIVVSHNLTTLPSATEVEVRIDTDPQITKTKTGLGIVNISASSFTIVIDDEDTTSVKSGEYAIQVRYTDTGGKINHGRISPPIVRVRDSIFTSIE